jgi:hypothetical protein
LKGCYEMNWISISPVVIGVIYLIYSILRRDKINYYSRRYCRRIKMSIIKPSEFFRLQLKFSILNSIYLIIIGIIITIFNIPIMFIIVGLMTFHFINFLTIAEGKKKGYIYYK